MNTEWTPDPAQDQSSKRDKDQSRRFDGTQLKPSGFDRVNRDYMAHCFRWGWVKRHLQPYDFVLDIGCGQELPLAAVISQGVGPPIPTLMVACDWNPIKNRPNRPWLKVLDNFDFTSRYQECCDLIPDKTEFPGYERKFDRIVCFEVIEHMHTCDGRRLLEGAKQCLRKDGWFYLSTPVFNGKAAANHIHEYTIEELDGFIREAGFKVVERFGTFSSEKDIKPHLNPQQLADYERLKAFYDGDVVSCFYAPLFPDYSRNNCWLLQHA